MAGLTIEDLQTGYNGPDAGAGFLYPPEGVPGVASVPLQVSLNSVQQHLWQHHNVLGEMKRAFDEQMSILQLHHQQQVDDLRAEQQRFRQDNLTLQGRLHLSPGMPPPSLASKLDCPPFGSDDEGMDVKVGLHEFHTWRVQVVAWYAECVQPLSTKNVQVFTKLRGRAAQVVTSKVMLDQLCGEQGLERFYGGDCADNIVQAVTELLGCRKGDLDMLAWSNRLDHLAYCFANFGIGLDDCFTGMLALLGSGLNKDQRAMVVASTGRFLGSQNIVLAMQQLFRSEASSIRADCMYGAGKPGNKTPTDADATRHRDKSRVPCWRRGQRGHVQCDCPKKNSSSSASDGAFLMQSVENEAVGVSPSLVATDRGAGNVQFVVGHLTESLVTD